MSRNGYQETHTILEVSKGALLQTHVPKEIIESLTQHDLDMLAYHLYCWYSHDFIRVLEQVATAYLNGKGWDWEYMQDPDYPTVIKLPGRNE